MIIIHSKIMVSLMRHDKIVIEYGFADGVTIYQLGRKLMIYK